MSSPESMKSEKENASLRYPQRDRSVEEGSRKKSKVLEESVEDQIKPQSEDESDSLKEEPEEISEYEKLRKEPVKRRSLRLQRKPPQLQPLDLFQNSPVDSPNLTEEKRRLDEEVLPMDEDGERSDFMDSLKSLLSQKSDTCSQDSIEDLIKDMANLKLATVKSMNSTRVQSMCIHPNEDKLLVISGSKSGELGFWNATDGKMARFNPHLKAINCVTVDPWDPSKLYSTSFDGTVRRADVNKSALELVYQTDEKTRRCRRPITWHSHADEDTILIAHETGKIGVVDVRAKGVQRWYHCHPDSICTIHQHPKKRQYFLTASETGECKIWDLRRSKKNEDECVGAFTLPMNKKGLSKGLTSAFFSPDGTKALTTCNDDSLRIYDVSDLAHPAEMNRIAHNNHPGQLMSVFKAIWHPHSSDLLIVGSTLRARKIEMFRSSGLRVRELKDKDMTTVTPVIAMHPSLLILVGGNMSGKAHVFTTPELSPRYIKCDED